MLEVVFLIYPQERGSNLPWNTDDKLPFNIASYSLRLQSLSTTLGKISHHTKVAYILDSSATCNLVVLILL